MTAATLLPVKGTDTVDILKHDHDTIKQLLEQLVDARSTRERSTTFSQLKAALVVHNATEENLVYPALHEIAGGARESTHLYHETAEADVVVFKLDGLLRDGDETQFAEFADKLQAAVLEHIDEEENKAFVKLREGADAAQSERLAKAVREFRGSFQFELGAA